MLINEREILGTAVTDSSGNWSITTSELSEGDYSVFAKSLDSDGNSASSDEITFSITAPIEGTRDTLTGQATFNLDVDGNGEVGAFSDGLMVIRHLFGTAFSGAALTDGAIPDGSTYWNDQEPWIPVGNNIDALM